jgi:hypothetical protein
LEVIQYVWGDFGISDDSHKAMISNSYTPETRNIFEDNLTGRIILWNKHRFKDDPEFGKLLKSFWAGELTT